MSLKEVIVIDDGVDSAKKNKIDSSMDFKFSPIKSCHNDDPINQVLEILPHLTRGEIHERLLDYHGNVERTIGSFLEEQQQLSSSLLSTSTAKRALFTTSAVASELSTRDEDERKFSSTSCKDKHSSLSLSKKWYDCIEQLRRDDQRWYTDPEFPPQLSSIDGRQRRNNHDPSAVAVQNCFCGVPAAAKQVVSDGPNYGRFYLTCGKVNKRRLAVLPVNRPKESNANDQDETSPRRHRWKKDPTPSSTDQKEIQDASASSAGPVVIRNPYLKHKTSTPPSSPPTPQRTHCHFFQWDPAGAIGAATTSTINTRYMHLQWHHFGIENDSCLFQTGNSSSASNTVPLSASVRQGKLGNCWFLSALAVVAEQPHLIRRILPHQTLHPKGVYQINLYLDGMWQPILIDSFLPVMVHGQDNSNTSNQVKENRKKKKAAVPERQVKFRGGFRDDNENVVVVPAFCAAPNRQIWACLIEKAYAKAHGSYHQLTGGFIAEALQDLTGAPTETIVFQHVDVDLLWARILSFYQASFLMGVATAVGGDGLVGSHAYSILEVQEVSNVLIGEQSKLTDFFKNSAQETAGKSPEVEIVEPITKCVCEEHSSKQQKTTVRLVRIRNPWGHREWKGEWSVNSDRWTKNLRKRLGKETTFARGDGTFYMSFDDMLKRFHHMDVAKTHKEWIDASVDGEFVSNSDPIASSRFFYTFEVLATSEACITVIQPKKRSNTTSRYWYCDPSMLILRRKREKEDDWVCVASKLSGVKRQNHVEIFLEAGFTYCCLPFSCLASNGNGNIDGKFPFRLAVYSGSHIDINKFHECQSIRDVAVHILHKELSAQQIKNTYTVASHGILSCIHGCGSLYFVIINGAHDYFLSMKITIEVPVGLLIVLGNADETYDVAPRSQKLCAIVSTNGKSSNATEFSFRYLSSCVHVEGYNAISPTKKGDNMKISTAVDICLSGDLLTGSIDPNRISMRGCDTIDTFLWIPQLGAS